MGLNLKHIHLTLEEIIQIPIHLIMQILLVMMIFLLIQAKHTLLPMVLLIQRKKYFFLRLI